MSFKDIGKKSVHLSSQMNFLRLISVVFFPLFIFHLPLPLHPLLPPFPPSPVFSLLLSTPSSSSLSSLYRLLFPPPFSSHPSSIHSSFSLLLPLLLLSISPSLFSSLSPLSTPPPSPSSLSSLYLLLLPQTPHPSSIYPPPPPSLQAHKTFCPCGLFIRRLRCRVNYLFWRSLVTLCLRSLSLCISYFIL